MMVQSGNLGLQSGDLGLQSGDLSLQSGNLGLQSGAVWGPGVQSGAVWGPGVAVWGMTYAHLCAETADFALQEHKGSDRH